MYCVVPEQRERRIEQIADPTTLAKTNFGCSINSSFNQGDQVQHASFHDHCHGYFSQLFPDVAGKSALPGAVWRIWRPAEI